MKSQALQLYRTILRVHRQLPKEFKELGNLYVKTEFKAHKSVTDKAVIMEFLYRWTEYKNSIVNQLKQEMTLKGAKIDLDSLSDEQIIQLNELREEIKK